MVLTYDTLLARPAAPRPLYRRTDFPDIVTWDCLVREGHLIPLTEEVARHRTAAPAPELRAAALQQWRTRGSIIADASAAWIHAPAAGAVLTGAPPIGTQVRHRLFLHRGPVRLMYTKGTTRPSSRVEILVRRATLQDGDVDELVTPSGERVLVTAPTRTALDIAARYDHDDAVLAIRALVTVGASIQDALQRVSWASQWVARQRTMDALEAVAERIARLERSAQTPSTTPVRAVSRPALRSAGAVRGRQPSTR